MAVTSDKSRRKLDPWAWVTRGAGHQLHLKSWATLTHPTAAVMSPSRQRMAGHQVIGMFPARQRLDAIEPGSNVLVRRCDIEAELVRRIIEIGDEREVGDGGPIAENVRPRGKPLVENSERVVDAPLEEGKHRRIARRLGEAAQEAIGAEESIDLLIVEDHPAQRFELLVLALRLELARAPGEVGEAHARLTELLAAVHQHRYLAHLVDVGTIFGCPWHTLGEKVDVDGLPVGADQIEHEGNAVGVARLGKAIELVFGHGLLDAMMREDPRA